MADMPGDGTPARRARIVLLAADGLPNTVIAERTATSVPTVRQWRGRYEAGGLAALADLERTGRPRTVNDTEIVVHTLRASHRSSRSIAADLGLSAASVLEVWHRYGLRPWLEEPLTFATDPPLDVRIVEFAGLYLEPPHRAVALRLANDEALHVVCPTRTPEIEAWAPGASFHLVPAAISWDDLVEILRSTAAQKETFRSDPSPPAFADRLGFLLKHAYLRHVEDSAAALAPLGIDGRELALLALFGGSEPLSQMEAAGRLGVDPATMVTLVDALERKELLQRRRSTHDRRRNIVSLTETGMHVLAEGERTRQDVERRFLAPLGEETTTQLIRSLQTLVMP
ncbi:helix-turn-helix domain-containing protein [Spirillospora sp. NPDC048911]|uniref:helix-turn-helix domain-containing protein n=1 Tax=Spirillospora sp. NPDC048911 TaxID=3364527 RepID=UPI0037179259